MAIDSTNKKLALMEMEEYYEPSIPLLPGVLGQDDQQQLLWGYPGILWVGSALFSNPILIESTMALSYQNGGDAPNTLAIFPRAIQWDNPAAAGHKVVIKESATGAVLFEATAQAARASQYFRPNRVSSKGARGGVKWLDFIVTQMDSGQLFIFYTN